MLPAASEAKVTCDGGGIPDASVELPGLPRDAEAGRLYELTVDLPEAHAVNPQAVLMAVRCTSLADEPATVASTAATQPCSATQAPTTSAADSTFGFVGRGTGASRRWTSVVSSATMASTRCGPPRSRRPELTGRLLCRC
jgi:hypothetical protein